MRIRRRPSEHFQRRLNRYRDAPPEPVVELEEKPLSWIRKFKEGDGWLWAEVVLAITGLAGFIFLVPTGYALWVDLQDRQTQRIAQAWETVTRSAPGNSGKGPALEYLNSQGIPLLGIDLSVEANESTSFLQRVDLSGADLRTADLSGADLLEANLSGADLYRVNLSGAYLLEADLSETDLVEANLSGAILSGADLSDASLVGTILSDADLVGANLSSAAILGANLSGAHIWSADLSGAILLDTDLSGADLSGTNLVGADLSQELLDTACGDEETQLPEGLTIKTCDEE